MTLYFPVVCITRRPAVNADRSYFIFSACPIIHPSAATTLGVLTMGDKQEGRFSFYRTYTTPTDDPEIVICNSCGKKIRNRTFHLAGHYKRTECSNPPPELRVSAADRFILNQENIKFTERLRSQRQTRPATQVLGGTPTATQQTKRQMPIRSRKATATITTQTDEPAKEEDNTTMPPQENDLHEFPGPESLMNQQKSLLCEEEKSLVRGGKTSSAKTQTHQYQQLTSAAPLVVPRIEVDGEVGQAPQQQQQAPQVMNLGPQQQANPIIQFHMKGNQNVAKPTLNIYNGSGNQQVNLSLSFIVRQLAEQPALPVLEETQAAGIFNHLRGILMASIQQDPTPDLNPETLSALSALMLAQAQECFVQKAIQDRTKDAEVAKLAAQCEELYAEALKQLQKEALRPLWDKEWIPIVAGKQAAYHGLSQFYQSLVCHANKAIGEEIARLEHALELFKAAQQRSNKPMFQDFVGRAQRALTESRKDNDFIYHERVPDVKSLTPISKASLAKQLPIPERMSQDHKDLFEALVPVAVHQAMAAYSVHKSELVNTEIARLRESTQLLNSILASLNLPAALEDISGSELPQSVRDKADAVKANGGIASLQHMVQELPELLQRNKDVLDECDRMIQEEASSDCQLREQFKEKWTRIPSEKLTETFRANISKYQTIIRNTVEAATKVRAKIESNREGITLLSGSADQLNAAVPSCAANAVTQSSAAQQLRALMEQVETIKAERDVVESELNSATTDIQAMFLQALSKENSISEQNLSVEMLGRIYGPLQKQVQDSLIKQEALVGQIQRINSEFCREKSGVGSTAHQREEMLKKLASAHDVYMELLGNLKEGSKFYNDLTQLLVTFQNKVSEFCFARKTEKKELMKDLTQEASRQASIPTPKASPHFETPLVFVPGSAPAASTNTLPYPVQYTGMTVPYAAPGAAPYPTYATMPSGYNPYSLPQAP